jgi:hypothetical protein
MSNPYRYPEVGHVYRRCVMCDRPFRVCKSALARRSAKFCTVRCYHAALRAFTEALGGDRIGLISGRAPQKAKGALTGPGDVLAGKYVG